MPETIASDKGIIYNVTIKVDQRIATTWLDWLREEHIPAIIATGCFTGYKVVRLLEIDEAEGPTYAVQYFATDLAEYTRYIRDYAPVFRQDSSNKWGEAFIAFRSLMEVIV